MALILIHPAKILHSHGALVKPRDLHKGAGVHIHTEQLSESALKFDLAQVGSNGRQWPQKGKSCNSLQTHELLLPYASCFLKTVFPHLCYGDKRMETCVIICEAKILMAFLLDIASDRIFSWLMSL